MKQWFPFTDYDFYAYLTAGMIFIAAADYALGGGTLVHRSEWTVVQVVFWTAIAYLAGHVLAGPSSAVLEHLVARRLLRPPAAICLGTAEPRRRERVVAALFAGREYRPLPAPISRVLIEGAAASLKLPLASALDAEAVFRVAYRAARGVPDAAARMDQFRNLYGFSRNAAFAALLAVALLLYRLAVVGDAHTALLAAGGLALFVGMLGRFLKFYAAFAHEVLGGFQAVLTVGASGRGTTPPAEPAARIE